MEEPGDGSANITRQNSKLIKGKSVKFSEVNEEQHVVGNKKVVKIATATEAVPRKGAADSLFGTSRLREWSRPPCMQACRPAVALHSGRLRPTPTPSLHVCILSTVIIRQCAVQEGRPPAALLAQDGDAAQPSVLDSRAQQEAPHHPPQLHGACQLGLLCAHPGALQRSAGALPGGWVHQRWPLIWSCWGGVPWLRGTGRERSLTGGQRHLTVQCPQQSPRPHQHVGTKGNGTAEAWSWSPQAWSSTAPASVKEQQWRQRQQLWQLHP